jgi:probable F420-dependent oxidoreductase
MQFAIQIFNLEPQRFRDMAQTVEGLGYDLIVFPDHVVMEGPGGQVDSKALAYDPISIAVLVAEATKRIRIGHLVLCNLFRHPVMTAQALMTLDHISGGRSVAGLGTGWTEVEFRQTGIAFPPIGKRLEMLDEALTCIRSLWTNETTTFDGAYYKLRDAILWPKPIQKPYPPILLGGGGKGLLRLAAKHADIVNINLDVGKPGTISLDSIKNHSDASFKSKVEFVAEEARRLGRKPGAVAISDPVFFFTITDSAAATRQTLEGMAPMFGLTPEALVKSPMALVGTPDECIVELKRRKKEWGATQFTFSAGMAGADERAIRRLKEEILDHV